MRRQSDLGKASCEPPVAKPPGVRRQKRPVDDAVFGEGWPPTKGARPPLPSSRQPSPCKFALRGDGVVLAREAACDVVPPLWARKNPPMVQNCCSVRGRKRVEAACRSRGSMPRCDGFVPAVAKAAEIAAHASP
jgi:hypothetical protein